MICPSCGEFVSTDNPKTCPFCGVDLEHFAFPNAARYGVPSGRTTGFEIAPRSFEEAREPDVTGLEFKRPTGFAESGPRKYIDKRLPRCPFCRSGEPLWEYAVVSGWLNRANFRCQKCRGVLSIPLEATKRSASSLFGALSVPEYLRIERVGDSPGLEAVAPKLVGGEFTLERLRTWAERTGAELPASAS